MARFAVATLLTSDSYLPGALVTLHSLKDLERNNKYGFDTLCLVTPGLGEEVLHIVEESFDKVITIQNLYSSSLRQLQLLGRPDLFNALSKLFVFGLTQYEKIIYLDADVLVLKPISHLFELECSFAAAPDIGWPDCFNSGMMVLKPKVEWLNTLLSNASTLGSWDGADQGLLNDFFQQESATSSSSTATSSTSSTHPTWHRLSYTYNVTPSAYYTFVPAFLRYRSDISVVHFIGPHKPWHRRTRPPESNQQEDIYNEILNKWFDVFERHYGSIYTSDIIYRQDNTTQSSKPIASSHHDIANPTIANNNSDKNNNYDDSAHQNQGGLQRFPLENTVGSKSKGPEANIVLPPYQSIWDEPVSSDFAYRPPSPQALARQYPVNFSNIDYLSQYKHEEEKNNTEEGKEEEKEKEDYIEPEQQSYSHQHYIPPIFATNIKADEQFNNNNFDKDKKREAFPWESREKPPLSRVYPEESSIPSMPPPVTKGPETFVPDLKHLPPPPKVVFPWEEEERPKLRATRVFPEDIPRMNTPPAIRRRNQRRLSAAQSSATTTPTRILDKPFHQEYSNAWDNDAGIENYVRTRSRQISNKQQKTQDTSLLGKNITLVGKTSSNGNKGKHSLKRRKRARHSQKISPTSELSSNNSTAGESTSDDGDDEKDPPPSTQKRSNGRKNKSSYTTHHANEQQQVQRQKQKQKQQQKQKQEQNSSHVSKSASGTSSPFSPNLPSLSSSSSLQLSFGSSQIDNNESNDRNIRGDNNEDNTGQAVVSSPTTGPSRTFQPETDISLFRQHGLESLHRLSTS